MPSTVSLRGTEYEVVLPRLADPRVHVAAVIVTVQVLGQTVLGFDVSIAQILLSLAVAASIEVGIVASTRHQLAWPASALLTANGVALLLRVPGTEHGDWWSLRGWPIFVAAAGVSLLSKYAVRVGDRHIFNPSNFGLVVVFLVFGSDRVDPQDLWWGPLSPALVLTFAVIVVGGITLARRLHLFAVAAAFWVTFAAAMAVLAVAGHAITARWHVGPVEGWTFWWIVVTSPEIVIFVFFMITDPRTAPRAAAGRFWYATGVAFVASALIAVQRTEYATKVALLAALTLVCIATPWLERARLPRPRVLGLLAVGALAVVWGADALAPGPRIEAEVSVASSAAGRRPAVEVPPDAVPVVTLAPSLDSVAGAVSPEDAQRLGLDLVEDLAIEADAIGRLDPESLPTATIGERLRTTEAAIEEMRRAGTVTVASHRFDRLEVVLLQDQVNPQAVPQLGLAASGWADEVEYAGSDSGEVLDQRRRPIDVVYLLVQVGDHYLVARELPADADMVITD